MLFASALGGTPVANAMETTGTVGGADGPGGISVVSTSTVTTVTTGDGGDDADGADDGEGGGGAGNRFEGVTEFPWTCFFDTGTTLADAGAQTTTSPVDGQTYHLYCNPNPGFTNVVDRIDDFAYVYNAADPFPDQPGLITSIQVREMAEDRAAPTTLTPGLSPDGRQITGVETWFWPKGSTETVTAQASAGGLTVTVEARYVETTFTVPPPNDATFTCDSYVEWTPGATESPCTYAFTTETPGQAVIADSRWDFYWFDNLLAQEPVLYATVTNTEVANVPVIDLEAVITRN